MPNARKANGGRSSVSSRGRGRANTSSYSSTTKRWFATGGRLQTPPSALPSVRELVAQTKLMRSYKGEFVYPLVELSHTFMPTSYGGRERPNLVVKNWVRFGEGGSLVLPTPNKPALTGSAAATVESKPAATSNPLGMQVVEKPTAKEVTRDEIKY